jgi:hypothetical protein
MTEALLPEPVREQIKQLVDDWEYQNCRLADEINRLDNWILASALAINLSGVGVIFGSEKIDHRSMWWACLWFSLGVVSAFAYALSLRFNQRRMLDYGAMRVGQIKQYRLGLAHEVPQGMPHRTGSYRRFHGRVKYLQGAPLLTFVIGCGIVALSL